MDSGKDMLHKECCAARCWQGVVDAAMLNLSLLHTLVVSAAWDDAAGCITA